MATKTTKIFGMNVGFDPKLVVLLLIVAAGIIYYFTSGSETPSNSSQAATKPTTSGLPLSALPAGRAAGIRRTNVLQNDRGTLKLVAVNGANGDVDPTLRLGLLERVKNVPPSTGLRNLFEAGGAAVAANLPPVPKNPPKLPPGPLPPGPGSIGFTPPPPPPFSIPLKYYGFVKPSARAMDGNRGFFMDGDNILIGAEGDVLEKRFLIVALTPNTARLEDTQVKQGQDLQVTPEAPSSQ